MEDGNGKKLFTFKELAQLTKGTTRESALDMYEQFEKKERNFDRLCVSRKPKIDEEVIRIVKKIVRREPLATLEEIAKQANKELNREDISHWNIEWILSEYVQYYEIRKIITKRLEKGEYKYKEGYVIKRLWEIAFYH